MPVAPASDKGDKGGKKLKPVKFGRYLLLDRIASGGMAEVWRAKIFGAEDFQRIVAIKKILPHVAEDTDFITMFKDEAKITVLLQHANIGQVYELGKNDDAYYIAMEYVPGKDGKTIWQHQRHLKQPLPVPLACYMVQNLAEGLDYAHRKKDNFGVDLKIVHRDVSPQNILVSWEGEVKLIDFGIAKAAGKASKTQAGILKGKFGYMAPEQVRGLPIDQRADVFAMGVVLYELVTGQRAFKADSDFSLLEMVRNVELTPPSIVNKDIPDELEKIMFKALAKDPDDRYQWASDLSEALQRFMLLHGKPSNRMDMGKYLRENFTVDYDRERLRMEAFREIEMPDEPASITDQPTAQVQVPPELDRSSAAVMAALAEEMGAPAPQQGLSTASTGSFATARTDQNSSVPSRVAARDNSQPGLRRDGSNASGKRPLPSNQGAIRPAIRIPAAGAKGKSGPLRLIGIALGALLGTVGLGLLLSLFLIGKGTIFITCQPPSDVQVFLDGTLVGTTVDGSLTVPDVKAGPHDLAAQKSGYVPFSGSVAVPKSGTLNIPIEMKKLPDPVGRLDVVSTPPGARIFVKGRDTEKVTPAVIENVTIGADITVELKLEDYSPHKSTVALETDQTQRIEAKLESRFVTAFIDSDPTGATVLLNGEEKGTTPAVLKHLDPQAAPPVLEIKKKRCTTYSTRMGLVEGEPEYRQTIKLQCK
ncbi:MAG: serine/threonine-protein kinase [Pseudomonadota bacterium]